MIVLQKSGTFDSADLDRSGLAATLAALCHTFIAILSSISCFKSFYLYTCAQVLQG